MYKEDGVFETKRSSLFSLEKQGIVINKAFPLPSTDVYDDACPVPAVEHHLRGDLVCGRGYLWTHGQRRHHRRPQPTDVPRDVPQTSHLSLLLRFTLHR
jgi:hypothetical protein